MKRFNLYFMEGGSWHLVNAKEWVVECSCRDKGIEAKVQMFVSNQIYLPLNSSILDMAGFYTEWFEEII
jgi:hypothetical protein